MGNIKRASVIVAAAGNSSRMGGKINKQFMILKDKPVLAHTLSAFSDIPEITEIIVVTRKEDIDNVRDLVSEYGIQKVKDVIEGGKTRQESVMNGLNKAEEEFTLIHDGARPFITKEEIKEIISALSEYPSAAPGVAPKDTIKRVDESGIIAENLNRDELIMIQTPQGFWTEEIKKAHLMAKENGDEVSDDCALLERMGLKVKITKGSYRNLKITTPEDLVNAEAFLG